MSNLATESTRLETKDFGALPPAIVGQWGFTRREPDGEPWRSEWFGTREEAIVALAEECDEQGEEFHGYVGVIAAVPVESPDADDVIDRMGELAYEECGEVAEGWPDVTAEQKNDLQRRLNKAIGEWLTEHALWPDFCQIDEITEATAIDLPMEK